LSQPVFLQVLLLSISSMWGARPRGGPASCVYPPDLRSAHEARRVRALPAAYV
jgi:hypothetical protein